jgi:hypothetical protein
MRRVAGAAIAAAMLAAPALASAECKLSQIAEFKLDPNSYAPVVDGSINGHPVKVELDTGSDFSMITAYEARRLGLPTVEATGWRAHCVGGSTQVYWAHVDQLKFGDLSKASIDFAVAGDQHRTSEVGVVIGDDVLSKSGYRVRPCPQRDPDVRAARLRGAAAGLLGRCLFAGRVAAVAARPAPHPDQRLINARPVLAELDSGAEASIIDTSAAAASGVTRSGANVQVDPVRGAGPKPEESWIGRFDSFALGDEKIAHVNIQVVNIMRGESVTETGSITPSHVSSTAMAKISCMRTGCSSTTRTT